MTSDDPAAHLLWGYCPSCAGSLVEMVFAPERKSEQHKTTADWAEIHSDTQQQLTGLKYTVIHNNS